MHVTRQPPPASGSAAQQRGSANEPGPALTVARVVLRPIASPLTLTFLALAVGTFILAGLQLSWIPMAQSADIGLALIVFVFPLQAVGSVFGFFARDSIAGTGAGLLSATWLGIGVVTFTGRPGQTSGALGLLLISAATVLLVPATVGAASKPLASLIIGGVALRFYLMGGYELSSASAWKYAGAAEGLLLAVVAFYAALAFELEDDRRRTVLPTLRRGAAREAIAGTLAEELNGLQQEAGVRKQL